MEQQSACCVGKFKEPKFILAVIGIVFLAAIIIVSLLRDRWISLPNNQVTVTGQGKVSYQPDQAEVTLGVQVDKVAKADEALAQMTEKINKIISAVEGVGIKKEDITTQTYSLYPQYDYTEGKTIPAGYNANQQLIIKVKEVDANPDLVGQVVSVSSSAGANQVVGINYSISDVNELKQEARLKAIADAKSKSKSLFAATGIKEGRIVGWYENPLYIPDVPMDRAMMADGMGGAKAEALPQVPSGTQELIIEIGLNYEVR